MKFNLKVARLCSVFFYSCCDTSRASDDKNTPERIRNEEEVNSKLFLSLVSVLLSDDYVLRKKSMRLLFFNLKRKHKINLTLSYIKKMYQQHRIHEAPENNCVVHGELKIFSR